MFERPHREQSWKCYISRGVKTDEEVFRLNLCICVCSWRTVLQRSSPEELENICYLEIAMDMKVPVGRTRGFAPKHVFSD